MCNFLSPCVRLQSEEELSWIGDSGCQATSELEREVAATAAQELLDLALDAESETFNKKKDKPNILDSEEEENWIDQVCKI